MNEAFFKQKVSELAHMKCISIPKDHVNSLFYRFSSYDENDLNQAIETLIYSEERFDFTKLLKALNRARADRIEGESSINRISEAKAAERFFEENEYAGECTREACKNCQHFKSCKVRGKEWIKGINTILSSKHGGKKQAQELINYMKYQFMGGI